MGRSYSVKIALQALPDKVINSITVAGKLAGCCPACVETGINESGAKRALPFVALDINIASCRCEASIRLFDATSS